MSYPSPGFSPIPYPSVTNISTNGRDKAHDLHRVFTSDSKGSAVKDFLVGLDDYEKHYDPLRHHGRSIALLQSSGTGKSKLMHDLNKHVRITDRLETCFH